MSSDELRVSVSRKGRKMLVLKGNTFGFQKLLKGGLARWTCNINGCRSFVKTISIEELDVVECQEEHNHEEMPHNKIQRQEIISDLKRKAIEDICERPSKIIYQKLKGEDTQDITTRDVNNFRKSIYKARRKILPKLPTNAAEVHDVINTLNVETTDGTKCLLENNTEKKVIIFCDSANLKTLTQCESIYVDGTFKCCPKFFCQLFTILGLVNGHYIPLVLYLLNDKKTSSYQYVFQSVVDKCSDIGLNFSPSTMFSDFEESIMKAGSEVWPDIRIQGCKFHLTQSWWRKIQTLGLAHDYYAKNEIGRFLSYIFGLPMLAPDMVGDCFVDDFMAEMPASEKLQAFCDYLVETYIEENSLFPPSMWAELSCNRQRTTNACESFHSKYNSQFYSCSPDIYRFLEVLKQIQLDSKIAINSSKTKKKERNCPDMKFMEQQVVNFKAGKISRFQYVKSVSYKIRPGATQ